LSDAIKLDSVLEEKLKTVTNGRFDISFSLLRNNENKQQSGLSYLPEMPVISKNSTAKKESSSKRSRTAAFSLFIMLFSFGLFVNTFSGYSSQLHQSSNIAPHWRTGRVILAVENWYHKYLPTVMHPMFDFIYERYGFMINDESIQNQVQTAFSSEKLVNCENRDP